jgi:hypothetical protein
METKNKIQTEKMNESKGNQSYAREIKVGTTKAINNGLL